MKNIMMIIAIAITATAFINCGSNMSLNPSDDEIALCNENPSTCNIGEEIVIQNGQGLTKDPSGTKPTSIQNTLSKTRNSSTPIVDETQKDPSGT